jgi:hypothetical protein
MEHDQFFTYNLSRRLDFLGPTQPPIQWIPGLKQPGCETDHSPPSSTDFKNMWRWAVSSSAHKRCYSCETVRQNHKGMPGVLDKKVLKVKLSDMLLVWNVSWQHWQRWFGKTNETCMYWQICINHHQKATFVMNRGKLKNLSLLHSMIDMCYIDKGDRMADSYLLSHGAWSRKKKYIFNLTILNGYIILEFFGSQVDHRKFHLVLDQNLLEMSSREPRPQSTLRGRPNPSTGQMTQLEGWQVTHWAVSSLCLWCHMHSQTQTFIYHISVQKCKVALCLHSCFRIYHTEVHFWNMGLLHHGKETSLRM